MVGGTNQLFIGGNLFFYVNKSKKKEAFFNKIRV